MVVYGGSEFHRLEALSVSAAKDKGAGGECKM